MSKRWRNEPRQHEFRESRCRFDRTFRALRNGIAQGFDHGEHDGVAISGEPALSVKASSRTPCSRAFFASAMVSST